MGEYGVLPTPTRSYTVTFNANGGSTPSQTSKTVAYTFDGWYTAESGGSKVESTTIMSTHGGTLYARWTAPTYGTLPTCSSYTSGDYRYDLKGWYTALSGGANVTSTTTANLTSDQTLYAQWNPTAQFASVTIVFWDGIERVFVNGVSIASGATVNIKQGDVIVAVGSKGREQWYTNWTSSDADFSFTGEAAICTAPASSGTGRLEIHFQRGYTSQGYTSREDCYAIKRTGACESWVFREARAGEYR